MKNKAFEIVIEYDGENTVTVDYQDGSDTETYRTDGTTNDILRIAREATEAAGGEEDD